jgi:hypothetical protein
VRILEEDFTNVTDGQANKTIKLHLTANEKPNNIDRLLELSEKQNWSCKLSPDINQFTS